MRLSGVIFDLDGTLGDTLGVCFAAFRSVFRRHLGRTLSDEEIHSLFGPSDLGLIRKMVPDRAESCYREYLETYEAEHRRCRRPFAGIPELLEGLRGCDVRLAVVTGKGPDTAAISLRMLALERYFDSVESGSDDGPIKPESMRRVLDRWGVEPNAVVGVGDAAADVRAARAAGIRSVGAGWADQERARKLAAAGPDRLCRSVAEAPAAIFEGFAPPAEFRAGSFAIN